MTLLNLNLRDFLISWCCYGDYQILTSFNVLQSLLIQLSCTFLNNDSCTINHRRNVEVRSCLRLRPRHKHEQCPDEHRCIKQQFPHFYLLFSLDSVHRARSTANILLFTPKRDPIPTFFLPFFPPTLPPARYSRRSTLFPPKNERSPFGQCPRPLPPPKNHT